MIVASGAKGGSKRSTGGYANGLQWVKTPLGKGAGAQMPTRDADGRIRYDHDQAPSLTFIPAVGTTSTVASNKIMEITEGDPNSCRMKVEYMNRWQREDWDCTIEFGGELTSTAEQFQLREWIVAKKGDEEIFRRETPSTIKRDLL